LLLSSFVFRNCYIEYLSVLLFVFRVGWTLSGHRHWVEAILLLILLPVVFLAGLSLLEAGCTPTITPPTPTAGVAFTITGPCSPIGTVQVFSGPGCTGTQVFSAAANGAPYSVNVPGLLAGSYSARDGAGQVDCVNFTIVPAAIPEYPLGLTILAVLLIVAYSLVKRKASVQLKLVPSTSIQDARRLQKSLILFIHGFGSDFRASSM
jgi:hypothetical protein